MTESPNEPQLDPTPASPEQRRRGSSLTLPLIVLIFAAGVWAGYGGRPYVERLLATQSQGIAGVVQRGQSLANGPQTTTTAAVAGNAPSAVASGMTATGATAQTVSPVLITPTPDRSGEINQYILANVKHFQGDPKAPVVMIEFSDFQ